MDLISKFMKSHMQFLQVSSERPHTFSIKNNGNSFSLPNGISIVGYRTHIGFSIHRQEFDEYGAENINDAHPRARELTRGQKAGRNKSGREVRAREVERTWREGRAEKKKDCAGGGERVNEQTVEDWGG